MTLSLALGSFLTLAALPLAPQDGSWPHLRGPHQNGRTAAPLGNDDLHLVMDWRVRLGPGYSGLVVAGGRVVTMFSDGRVDSVIALDAESGAVIWQHELEETYRGHDGSDDGPVSTPVIADGRVFAIATSGKLVALDLAAGGALWELSLVDAFQCVEPDFGFTTTPLVEGELLIVQGGGAAGHALLALDVASGELRWSNGDSTVEYQSPIVIDVDDARHLVLMEGKRLRGLAPETGEVLWVHALAENEGTGSGLVTPLGGNRFLAPIRPRQIIFEIVPFESGVVLEEVCRTRELGGSYAMPVSHEGYLFGFRSSFLTCVDAQTGKRVWKSRPPGGAGLLLAGDHLIIFGAEGHVVAAKASPAGYQEEARLRTFEFSSLTWPSCADGHVFLRNATHVASIALAGTPPASVSMDEPSGASMGVDETGGRTDGFGAFLAQLELAEEPSALLDKFLASQETFPIIEGNSVHFVYRGEVEDIAIVGSMLAGKKPQALRRVPGTDLYHISFEIVPGARWEYRFQVDFGQLIPDPLNPLRSPATRGAEVSEVVTPDYARATHYLEPAAAPGDASRGRLDSFRFKSEQLENEREIKVYLPPYYDLTDRTYPLLLVHAGPDWIQKGQLTNTLDNRIARGAGPVVVAFIGETQEPWTESGGSLTTDYVDMLATELVGELERRYSLMGGPAARAVFGHTHWGVTAAYAALRHPDVFGKAAVQSIALGDITDGPLFELLESGERHALQFYLDWNRYEPLDMDRSVDYRADNERFSAALKTAGYEYVGGEALDAHGWESWRSRSDSMLEAMFPAPK